MRTQLDAAKDSLTPEQVLSILGRQTADAVRQPAHYTAGKIETIDFIEQALAHYPAEVRYHIGNVLKYLSRAPLKGTLDQDLDKAAQYLSRARNLLAGKAEW
jgi:hypothetical protein